MGGGGCCRLAAPVLVLLLLIATGSLESGTIKFTILGEQIRAVTTYEQWLAVHVDMEPAYQSTTGIVNQAYVTG